MTSAKLHADEPDVDAALVRRLVRAQFPHWADLPIEAFPSAGTDNAIYRLGQDMAVRLPRLERVVSQIEKEQRWLPVFAPHLPLAVSLPLAAGVPAEGFPWPWSVYRWLQGESAATGRLDDPDEAARALAAFLRALRALDTTGGPAPSSENFRRGVPLVERDAATRRAIGELEGRVDTDGATAAWEAALRAPGWDRPPVWIHGDLLPGNLLVHEGRLSAVIDWGGLGVGDPAVDLITAWSLFSAGSRETFRAALDVDDATWARGRGWALSIALIALPYYWDTNPGFAAVARRTLDEVLSDP